MSLDSYKKSEDLGTAQPRVQPADTMPPAYESEQARLTAEKSPGVARIEAINRHLTFANRVGLFIGVFLIAYAYGLDGTVRYTYQVIQRTPYTGPHGNSLISYLVDQCSQ